MIIKTRLERLNDCKKDNHIFREYHVPVSLTRYESSKNVWYSNHPKIKVWFETIYERRLICTICAAVYTYDYKRKLLNKGLV